MYHSARCHIPEAVIKKKKYKGTTLEVLDG
jgi:hypothetical protein